MWCNTCKNNVFRRRDKEIYFSVIAVFGNGEWKSRTNRELEEISKGENIVKWIKDQRRGWLGHLERMDEDRMPKKIVTQGFLAINSFTDRVEWASALLWWRNQSPKFYFSACFSCAYSCTYHEVSSVVVPIYSFLSQRNSYCTALWKLQKQTCPALLCKIILLLAHGDDRLLLCFWVIRLSQHLFACDYLQAVMGVFQACLPGTGTRWHASSATPQEAGQHFGDISVHIHIYTSNCS